MSILNIAATVGPAPELAQESVQDGSHSRQLRGRSSEGEWASTQPASPRGRSPALDRSDKPATNHTQGRWVGRRQSKTSALFLCLCCWAGLGFGFQKVIQRAECCITDMASGANLALHSPRLILCGRENEDSGEALAPRACSQSLTCFETAVSPLLRNTCFIQHVCIRVPMEARRLL